MQQQIKQLEAEGAQAFHNNQAFNAVPMHYTAAQCTHWRNGWLAAYHAARQRIAI